MSGEESIVIKQPEFSDDLVLPQNADELAKFMDEPFSAIAEAITGAMASGPKNWMAIGGRIVKSVFKGKLFVQFGREVKELRDRGKIVDDFADERKYRYGAKTWVELIAVIDEEVPDADRLDALKAMFYEVNKINATDSERIINYQMFQIAKRLTSAELLVLKATNEAVTQGGFGSVLNPANSITLIQWAEIIAKQMGHEFVDMVIRDQRRLTEEGLLSTTYTSITNAPRDTHFDGALHGRLTRLGRKFCESIREYHIAKGEQ